MQTWTEQDIISLIQLGEERPDLDYKDDIDLTAGKQEKAEITKDIIAMANSGGGSIIGGVRETPKGYEWKGMSQGALGVFDSTALNEFVKNYCAPPINTTTRKVEVGGRVYGVIIVPEFAGQPHIVIKDYPGVLTTGDILVRTASNNSMRAGPDDLRKLIDLAVQRRQGVLKDMLQAALGGSRPHLVGGTAAITGSVEAPFDRSKYAETYKGFRIVTMAPADAQISLQPMALHGAVKRAVIKGLDGYSDFPNADFHSSVEKRLPVGIVLEQEASAWPRLSFAFFGVHGNVFCADSMWEDAHPELRDAGVVGLLSTILMMFQATLFARQYYPALGYEGRVQVRYSEESSIPRVLFMDSRDHWPFHRRYDNNMAIPVTVERIFETSADLQTLEDVTKEMVVEFFWYFGFDLDKGEATQFLEQLKKKVSIPQGLRLSSGNSG
jgi:hypothetical protein